MIYKCTQLLAEAEYKAQEKKELRGFKGHLEKMSI